MSATELIKEVAALPPAEKTLFAELFHAMKNGPDGTGSAHPSKWPDIDERLRNIYGDKFAPDSQTIIADGRG
jgi:hypothetical protein